MAHEQEKNVSAFALSPLILFLVIFVGSGVYFTLTGAEYPFYQISPTVAILPALIVAILKKYPFSINERLEIFLEGVRDPQIILMCVIYLLAGAFSGIMKGTGGAESAVQFGLRIIPAGFLLPGIFLIASFVSLAMGTSMGTIAAITPIAIGIADAAGLSHVLTAGAIVGGAMFGDNLSFISDTTIAAVNSQGCALKDKFKFNFWIALPAMIVTILIYVFINHEDVSFPLKDYHALTIFPYAFIIVSALLGVNVLLVLMIGIVSASLIGLATLSHYSCVMLAKDIYTGFTSMQEILILSLFIGGLSALNKHDGGLAFLARSIRKITCHVLKKKESSLRVAEVSISAFVGVNVICTANNTVAILLSGDLARTISQKNKGDPRRSASLLDIFSCVVQGILPYSAQVLLASSMAGVSPLSLIGVTFYCLSLGLFGVLSILFQFPRFKPQEKSLKSAS